MNTYVVHMFVIYQRLWTESVWCTVCHEPCYYPCASPVFLSAGVVVLSHSRLEHLQAVITSSAATYQHWLSLPCSLDRSATRGGGCASGQTLSSSVLVLCDYSPVLTLCFPELQISLVCQPACTPLEFSSRLATWLKTSHCHFTVKFACRGHSYKHRVEE